MCENVYPTIAAKPLPERHGRCAGGGRSRRGGMVLRGPVASAPAIAGKTRAGGLRVARQTTVGGNHADWTIARKARIKCSNSHSLGGTEETTKGLPEELALSLPHRPAFYPLSPTSIAPRSPPPLLRPPVLPPRPAGPSAADQKADSPAQGSTPHSRFTRRAPAWAASTTPESRRGVTSAIPDGSARSTGYIYPPPPARRSTD